MATELTGHSVCGIRKAGRTTALSVPSGLPRTFEATATSTAGVIIASTLATYGSADDDFVGMFVEVVDCSNGTGEGGSSLRRKIKAYDHSAQKLSIEHLPFATADGDSFKLLEAGGYWAESTGGSLTSIIDASRDEADDYWNGTAAQGGPYMIPIACDDIPLTAGKLISNFANATGTATTAAFADSTAVGDLFEAWQWLEIHGGLPGTFNQPRVDRPAVTGNLGMVRGVNGNRDGSLSLEMAFRGPGTSGEPAELDSLLGAITTVTAAPSDETIASGTTTTSVNVGSAPAAASMWCSEAGDVCVATTAADPFVPSPTLRVAPAVATSLYGLRTYKPGDTLNYALDILHWSGIFSIAV